MQVDFHMPPQATGLIARRRRQRTHRKDSATYMRQKMRADRDPIEDAIEQALKPDVYIDYDATWPFVAALEEPVRMIDEVLKADPQRGMALYEAFLAGCYEKAEEIDECGSCLGGLIERLYAGWI